MAGQVAAVGDGVKIFSVGDNIVAANSASCGSCEYCERGRENLCADLQYINGAFAEYILVPKRFVERNTHRIPEELSYARAALTEPLACVLHGMDACELDKYGKGAAPVEVVVFGGGPIGLLFVGALAMEGHKVILADPNPSRLAVGKVLGATKTVEIIRGGGQAEIVKAVTDGGKGAWVAIDASGVPDVWVDAINCVRPGGLVNLFGGCAPGTSIDLDTHLLHYSELTVKGVYHHRPDTVRRALQLLADPTFKADLLLSMEMSIDNIEAALRAMIAKDALKVVVKN
jgi:L-iditol 2-dehydrogenase